MEAIFGSILWKDLGLILPELILLAIFILLIIIDLIFKNNKLNATVSIIGSLIVLLSLLTQQDLNNALFMGIYIIDAFGVFFKFLVILSTLIVFLMSIISEELHNSKIWLGEYYILIFGMAIGMFFISGSVNLILIYLSLETMSMSSYVLAGYTKQIRRASEASLKYVIFGSLSSGIMIFGISLLYGLTGSLDLNTINLYIATDGANNLLLFVSFLFILVGFGYKISAVPFHFWTPDVYEGSPITITAYLSVASKAAGFAVFVRFLYMALVDNTAYFSGVYSIIKDVRWDYVIAVLSVLTMTLGNVVALWQNNVKRMLAYSSIAHAGYILMAVTVMSNLGISSILIYLFFYLFMNFGAFLIVMIFAHKIGSEDMDKYVGLGYRSPLMATLLTIILVSLIGLPPTGGFIGKLYVFWAVLDKGLIWLAVIGILNSVISLYYYAKVIRNMWLRDVDSQNEKLKYTLYTNILAIVLTVPILLFFVYFSPILKWAESSANIFLGK